MEAGEGVAAGDYKGTAEYRAFTLALPAAMIGGFGAFGGSEMPMALRVAFGLIGVAGLATLLWLMRVMLRRPHRH